MRIARCMRPQSSSAPVARLAVSTSPGTFAPSSRWSTAQSRARGTPPPPARRRALADTPHASLPRRAPPVQTASTPEEERRRRARRWPGSRARCAARAPIPRWQTAAARRPPLRGTPPIGASAAAARGSGGRATPPWPRAVQSSPPERPQAAPFASHSSPTRRRCRCPPASRATPKRRWPTRRRPGWRAARGERGR